MGQLSINSNGRSRSADLYSSNLTAAIMALSPLGFWKLDEGAGTTAFDSSGNIRNGTYTGGGYTLRGAAGGNGRSYVDLGNGGSSSHVAIADNNVWSVNNTPGLTIFALIKPDSVAGTTAWQTVTKGSGSNFEWFFAVNNGVAARASFQVNTSAGSAIQNGRMTGDPITTAWQAIAIGVASTTTDAAFTMYRNNNTNIYTNIAAAGSGYTNGTATVQIGYRADSPANQYFQGGIAAVAIFAGQKSSTEIGTLMTAADLEGWY